MSEIPIKAMKYDDANKDPHQFYPLTVPEAIIFPDGTNGKQAFDAVINDMSDVFSDQKPYEVGDYCIYNNVLYKFIAQKTAGAWDSSKASVTTIDAELKSLLNQINTLYSGAMLYLGIFKGDFNNTEIAPGFYAVDSSYTNGPKTGVAWSGFIQFPGPYKVQQVVAAGTISTRRYVGNPAVWENWCTVRGTVDQ